MYVCLCKGVTDGQIRREVEQESVCSLRELRVRFGLATQCGRCAAEARRVLGEALCRNRLDNDEAA